MKIVIGKKLTDLEGNIVKDPHGKEATVRGAVIEALLAVYKDESDLSGETKLSRWVLAKKLHEQDEVDLTIREANIIKELVGRAYSPLIVGQIWELLEGIE